MSNYIFELGEQAEDKITGFKGIIVGRADHITGCNTYGWKPKIDKDGKICDAEWFDEGVLKIIGKGINKKSVTAKDNGGDLSEHPKI